MAYLRLVLLAILVMCVAAAAANPVPFINQPLVPDSAQPGGGKFTLTVNGAGFISASTVNWNGESLPTTFVSATRLTAVVPAADILTAQTASVTVRNEGPGGGSSNSILFPVRLPARNGSLQETSLGNVSLVGGSMAVADFNGDGKLDVANCMYDVAVSLGNGNGTFGNPLLVNPYGCGLLILAGDFNGDGKVDLATLGLDLNVYLGNGDGTFQDPIQTTGLPIYTWSFTAGDFNHDGNLDLAIGGLDTDNSGIVTLLFGKGDGTFAAPQNVRVHGGAQDTSGVTFVTTADINHDGNLDLAVVDEVAINNRQIFILLGKGNGSFQVLPSLGRGYGALALADFNGDGNLDLVSNTGSIVVALGQGDGTFGPPTIYKVAGTCCGDVVVGDFNGDGFLDVAAVEDNYPGNPYIDFLAGVGDGTFQPSRKFSSSLYTGGYLAAGDFNNDGKLDLLMSSSPDFGGIDAYLQEAPK